MVKYVYDAWGKFLSTAGSLTSTLGTIQPFRYRSYVYDQETGLYYLRSRYYNPIWQRFINADVNLAGNLFAYCSNAPLIKIDSDGFAAKICHLYSGGFIPDYTAIIFSTIEKSLPEFQSRNVGNGSVPSLAQIFENFGHYCWFAEQVALKGIWDVKQPASWEKQFPNVKMPTYSENVLFMGELVDSADIGNFTYGFFGASMGISAEMLHMAGGVTDTIYEGNNVNMSKLFDAIDAALDNTNGYYGDKEEDFYWIKLGIDTYYNEYHTGWN